MCSKKCGGGISYRKRKCVPSKCPYSDPQHNKCYGNDYEEKKCNENCCPGMFLGVGLVIITKFNRKTILGWMARMVCV